MVSLVIGILFFTHFTQAVPATASRFLVGYCDDNSDCASDECCVTNAQPDGKRLLSTLGTCQKLGKEISRCLVSSHLSPSSGMYYVCPCAAGFSCHGTGLYDVPLGEIGSCQGPSIRTRQTCQSGADCAADECCVSDVRPIGRRRRELFGAHCQKMGVDRSNCYVRYGSGKPNGTVFVACPCTSGLTCVGDHIYDVPLGEMGQSSTDISDKKRVNRSEHILFNMLSIIIATFLFAYIVQPISAAVSCNDPADCAPGECCVSDVRPKGKRDTSFRSTSGTCQIIGTDGSRCLVSHTQPLPSGMYYVCPCASGFKCLGTGQYDIPLGEIGSCRGPSTRIGQTCHSGDDCATNECCVSSVRPIGRRRQLGGAHCQQMGVDGSSCYVRQLSGKPNGTVFACPCSDGLRCVGSHMFDIPLGEVGTCHL